MDRRHTGQVETKDLIGLSMELARAGWTSKDIDRIAEKTRKLMEMLKEK